MRNIAHILIFTLLLCVGASLADIADETNVQLWDCGSNPQKWAYHSDDQTIRLEQDSKCLDIANYGTSDGSNVWLYTCHTSDPDPSHKNQEWVLKSDGSIVSTLSGKCLDASAYGTSPGTNIQIWTCTGADNQKWSFNATDSSLRGKQSGLCVNVGAKYGSPCEDATNKGYPFCNTALSFSDRVKDLVSRIPASDKIGLFANGAAAVPSLKLPSYQWWSEALHGVAGSPGVSFGGTTPYATSFPQIVSTGCTFDSKLVAEIGKVVGTEGRAMHNEGHAGLTFWAPNVNIFRDPRWGRGQETPGEDPYHAAEYAYNYVSALQGDDPKYLQISSCCKHFAAYNLENWGGKNRHDFNAIVTQQDLDDTYFPAFKSCSMRAKASSVMCSYNAVNGVPSCADSSILNDLLRAKWDFQGYITSDCGAVSNVYSTHHYTNTTDETCKVVLEAGMDIDCGGFLKDNLEKAIANKAVSSETVDKALYNLYMVQFRLGMFDPPSSLSKYSSLSAKDVDTTPSRDLALTAALKAMTLLKNDDNTLPFSKSMSKIALVGPNADATNVMQGNYNGRAPYLISPQAGLAKFTTVDYVKGCDISSSDKSGFTAACDAAKSSDATVMIMGLDQSQEKEGHDRDIISFPGVQEDFISEIAGCSKGPVVLVIMSGGQVDLSLAKANKKVGAIMFVGYPGQSGGDAIAQTIFGENSPAGRLSYTIYPADYLKNVSMFNMNMRPSENYPGRSYRFYNNAQGTVYPFGHGLTYTNFSVSTTSSVSSIPIYKIKEGVKGDKQIRDWEQPSISDVSVVVKNTGSVTSDYTFLSFAVPPTPGKNGNPLKYLHFFTRLYDVKPNESRTVVVPLRATDLILADTDGVRRPIPGTWKIEIGPYATSSTTFLVE